MIPLLKYLDICDSCVHRRIYVLSRGIPKPTTDNINNTCKLELDVYPVVPTISAQTQFNPAGTYGLSGSAQTLIAVPTYNNGLSGGYLNQSFTDSEQSSSSCVLENPDNIDLQLNQPPYLLSTYV